MSNERSVPKHVRYVLTQAGRSALLELPECRCKLRLDGGIFVCDQCGTCWALISSVKQSMWGVLRDAKKP